MSKHIFTCDKNTYLAVCEDDEDVEFLLVLGGPDHRQRAVSGTKLLLAHVLDDLLQAPRGIVRQHRKAVREANALRLK